MTVLDPPITPTARVSGIAASAVGVSKIYGSGDTEVRALDGCRRRLLQPRSSSRPSWARPGRASRPSCTVMAGLDTLTGR